MGRVRALQKDNGWSGGITLLVNASKAVLFFPFALVASIFWIVNAAWYAAAANWLQHRILRGHAFVSARMFYDAFHVFPTYTQSFSRLASHGFDTAWVAEAVVCIAESSFLVQIKVPLRTAWIGLSIYPTDKAQYCIMEQEEVRPGAFELKPNGLQVVLAEESRRTVCELACSDRAQQALACIANSKLAGARIGCSNSASPLQSTFELHNSST